MRVEMLVNGKSMRSQWFRSDEWDLVLKLVSDLCEYGFGVVQVRCLRLGVLVVMGYLI